jgi:hypothetical protein
MNPEIKDLFDEDQRDCLHQPADNTPEQRALRQRINGRMTKVQSIIEASADLSGEDYFHACILFLHGDCPEHFWQAHVYGLKSVELGNGTAKRFTATAYDRWLMYQGKPQKYGLQYVPDGVGLRVWDVDPLTTDAERAEWEVPPLAQLYENAREAAKNLDWSKIDLESKPQWLKDAIQRWKT